MQNVLLTSHCQNCFPPTSHFLLRSRPSLTKCSKRPASTFGNSNGLPDPANKMTVRELSRLARHIILTYPDFYKLFGEREYTWNKILQQNRNPLLNSLEGADGLKTGHTKEGGYGLVGSTEQNG